MATYTKRRGRSKYHAEIEAVANDPAGPHSTPVEELFRESGYATATVGKTVRTYDGWKNRGRQVKKGQKGIGFEVTIGPEHKPFTRRATFFHEEQTATARATPPKGETKQEEPKEEPKELVKSPKESAREELISQGVATYGMDTACEVIGELIPHEGHEVIIVQVGHGELCHHAVLWQEMSGKYELMGTDTNARAAELCGETYFPCHHGDITEASGVVDRIAIMDFRPGYGKRIRHCLSLLRPAGRLVALVPKDNTEADVYQAKANGSQFKRSYKTLDKLGAVIHIFDRPE
jgi:hypothetical protein